MIRQIIYILSGLLITVSASAYHVAEFDRRTQANAPDNLCGDKFHNPSSDFTACDSVKNGQSSFFPNIDINRLFGIGDNILGFYSSYKGGMASYVEGLGVLRQDVVGTYLCTDTSERRVPGMLVNGKCNVEWGGNEHQNTDYYLILNSGAYKWELVSDKTRPERIIGQGPFARSSWDVGVSNDFILEHGVSTGVYDDGNPVFFCRITRNDDYPPYDVLDVAYGKYIPSRNGCYFGYWGGRYAGRDHVATRLDVLVVEE